MSGVRTTYHARGTRRKPYDSPNICSKPYQKSKVKLTILKHNENIDDDVNSCKKAWTPTSRALLPVKYEKTDENNNMFMNPSKNCQKPLLPEASSTHALPALPINSNENDFWCELQYLKRTLQKVDPTSLQAISNRIFRYMSLAGHHDKTRL